MPTRPEKPVMRHSRQPTALYTCDGRFDFHGATSASQAEWSSTRLNSTFCLQCLQSVRTRRCAMTPFSVAFSRYAGTPSSSSRATALGESLVCSVESTRWPVSADCTAISRSEEHTSELQSHGLISYAV